MFSKTRKVNVRLVSGNDVWCTSGMHLITIHVLGIDWLMRKMTEEKRKIVPVLHKLCSEWYTCTDKLIKPHTTYAGKKTNLKKTAIN